MTAPMTQRKTYLIARSQINMAPSIMDNFEFQSSATVLIKKKTNKNRNKLPTLSQDSENTKRSAARYVRVRNGCLFRALPAYHYLDN